jgi:hypothetical protein
VGIISSAVNLQGHAVDGVTLGDPFSDDPYQWSWSGPDAEIVGTDVVAVDEDGQPYTVTTAVSPEAHAAALAAAAQAEADAVAAAEQAAAEREANIDKVPVIEAAVDDLIVAVLT